MRPFVDRAAGPLYTGHPPAPPRQVSLPVNVHHWDSISFLHWPVAPADLQRLLPEGLRPDLQDGLAWVGITPFHIRVRPLGVPVDPPGCSFPETNVRTYVVGPDGEPGIWFLHMEVTALWFVAALRGVGLPYVRRAMDVGIGVETIRYESKVTTGSGHGGHDIIVQPGEQLDPPAGGPAEWFLTARWTAYHRIGPLMLRTRVEHPPWDLRRAEVERCEVGGLFEAAGLSPADASPVVHFSPGVKVRVAYPVPVR